MRTALCPVIWMLMTMAVCAGTRLAVLSSDSDREVAALLTLDLSKMPGMELIERDEIQRMVTEDRVQKLASQGDYKQAGSLLHADGLIILSGGARSGQPLEQARL